MLIVHFVLNGTLCECHFPTDGTGEAAIQAAIDWAMSVPDVQDIATDIQFDPSQVTAHNTIPIEVVVPKDGRLTHKVTIY